MILSIPPPPSANRIWQRTPNGMSKSAEYKAWLTEALWIIKTQRLKAVVGPVAIAMACPTNGRRDLDNHCKPVLDLLVKAGLIDGDRFKTVKELHLYWHQSPAMLIEIRSWQPGQPTLVPSGQLPKGKLDAAVRHSIVL